jgi:hypothetical protein
MSIDSWLTTIGLLIAIIAFFPKPELKLLRLKLHLTELWAGFAILLVLLPLLIYFYPLAELFPFLNYFTFKHGILPKNAAFAFLYGLIIWLALRFIWLRPNKKFSQKILEYYLELIKEVPFDVFFNIFRRYENVSSISKVWPQFRSLFTHPLFLNGIIHYQPEFIYRNWECINRQEDFEQLLDLFVDNPSSDYYKGIQDHWNSYALIPYVSQLLNQLINLHLRQSLKFGIIKYISKKGANHIHREGFNSNSIYLQTPIFLDHASEGSQLPMFFHIQFISLLYGTSITDNKDIEGYGGKNMYSIYSQWTKQIIENLKLSGRKFTKKDNSNYHWLIGKMLDNAGDWMRLFNENDNFIGKYCSYRDFAPMCLGLCLKEVYKGYENELIPVEYIKSHIHHNVLNLYYLPNLDADFRDAIEKQIISNVPEKLVIVVFAYSLGEEFAMTFDDFYDGKFHSITDQSEINLVTRLRNLLKENKQLL